MKKLFSIILMAAMLVTCISPALYSSAADLPSFVVEENTGYDENASTVDVTFGIADNPGISELTVLVYYLDAEMSVADVADGDVFVDSSINRTGASDSRNFSKYFPVEEFGDTVYQVAEVTVYAPTEGIDETGNGTFLNTTFNLDGAHAAGAEFTYGIKVKEAFNANGDEIAFAGKQEGKVTALADPYKEIYENFTIFATDATVDLDAKEVTVELRMVNNPGVWGIRVFVVYDNTLKMTKFEHGDQVFFGADQKEVAPNYALSFEDDTASLAAEVAFENMGLPKEGKVFAQMLQKVSVGEENRYGNGVLARMTFALPEGMQQGDSFPIDVCWTGQDIVQFAGQEIVYLTPDHPTANIQTAICEHANVVLETVREASCSATGLESGVCPDCGQTVEKEIPMTAHTPAEPEVIAPTCTEAGKIVTKCSVCGAEISSIEDAEHPALGHDEENATENVVKAATCTEKGSKEIICGRCNEVIKTEEIDMIPHTEKVETKEATCTDAGRIITTCTVCNTVISDVEDTEHPALGHADGAPVVTKPATCTEKGSQDIFCERCDEKLRTEEIDMLAHTEKVETIAPTCTDAGRIITTCTVCGTEISNVEDAEHPALGHTYDVVEVIEPTCVDAGRIITKCSVCGDIESDVEDLENPATGVHTPGEPEIVEPTETEDGSKTVKCTVCGGVISVEEIPATGVVTTVPSTEDTTKAPNTETTAPNNNNKAPVKTGDNLVYVVVVAAVALVSCSALVVIRKRKVSDK